MNALQRYILAEKRDECRTMNYLQSLGVVSDNCASAGAVARPDSANAVLFLLGELGDLAAAGAATYR